MSGKVEILIVNDEQSNHVFNVGRKPFCIGRGPDNDLVVNDARISWNHTQVWIEDGKIWVKDLGSLNGTFINDERVRNPVEVHDGTKVRLGPELALQVRGAPPQELNLMPRSLTLEDLASGLQVPLRSDRFVMGSAEDADLRLKDAPAMAAMLIIHPDGEVWVGSEDETEHPVDLGEVFQVCGRDFQIVEADPVRQPTVEQDPERYPYLLTATLDGATGPEASLEDLANPGRVHRIESDNRAVLLFLLGRQRQRDREAGQPRAERGWCADADVVTGIWGRAGRSEDPNRLHVLVHRLRKELKSAGFDPWCIEKRRRYIRIRVAQISMT